MKQSTIGNKFVLVVSFVLFLSGIAMAEIPIPWGAKLLRDQITVSGNDEERKISTYETKAGKQELLNYYLREMPNRGYRLFMNGQQNLMFNKGDELVVVVVPPTQSGKTSFMITSASMKSAVGRSNAYGEKVNCASIPSVPVYPGAGCMNSTRLKTGESSSASYSTEDSGEVVLNFYRAQMPRFDWWLVKEINLEEVMTRAMQGKNQSAITPQQQEAMHKLYGSARGMFFTNKRGNGCSVHVMNNPTDKGTSVINILYEDKSSQ